MRIYIQLIICLMLTQPAFAQVVLQKSTDVANRYIVKFNSLGDVSAQLREKKSKAIKALRLQQQSRVDQLKYDLLDSDLEILRDLWIKQSVAISISSQYLSRLRALPYVAEVRADKQYQVKPLSVVTLPLSSEDVQDNLERVDIDSLWSSQFRGQGVVVALLDSGVDVQHLDLANRWRGGTNSWFDPYLEQPDPIDLTGHGTAVSSIVLGGDSTASYLGVAPNAQWIAARIFSNSGSSSESAISEALQWVLDPDGNADTDDFPDIVQNSWGMAATEGSCSNPFSAELAAIDALGIDLVFAVGNSGLSGPGPGGFSSYLTPSFDSHVISVGALKIEQLTPPTDVLLFDSSRGPDICGGSVTPSVVAPGQFVRTADLTFGGFDTDNTTVNIGTSFSSPHVSGALALLRSQFESLDHLQFRNALFDSAINLGDQNDYGRGLIQATAAATLLQNQVAPVIPTRAHEVYFSDAVYSFSESDLNARISVLRSGDITSAASVNISSADGTANDVNDYQSILTTLDFAAGESQKSVVIQFFDDSQEEINETFSLVLTQNFNVNLGSKATLVVTIKDDDGPMTVEDEIGGASVGILELMFLSLLWFCRRTR